MKYLYIVRHGKAVERSADKVDFERSLIEKGIFETKKVAKFLKDNHKKIDAIISSPSYRTKETTEIIADILNFSTDSVTYIEDLYEGLGNGIHPYINAIKGVDNDKGSILISGHNPDLTDLCKTLTGLEIPYMRKSSMIILKFNIKNWQDIKKGIAKLQLYICPTYID